MMKRLITILLVLIMATLTSKLFCSQKLEFKPLTDAEFAACFIPKQTIAMGIGSESVRLHAQNNTPTLSLGQKEYINMMLKLGYQTNQLEQKLQKGPSKKSTLRTTALAGIVAAGGGYALQSQTRSAFSLTNIVLFGLGAAGAAGGVYWWIGNEMGVIAGFKDDIENSLDELEKMQILIRDLKEQNERMQAKVDDTVIVTDKLNQLMPQVVGMAGDNATLAKVMRQIIDKQKNQEALIAALIAKLPQAEQEKYRKKITFNESAQRKAQALKEYNKRWFGFDVSDFSKIPHDWLIKHGFEDLIEKEVAI